MHYSRVSVAPSEKYSAASAVFMTELLKGSISVIIAYSQTADDSLSPHLDSSNSSTRYRKRSSSFSTAPFPSSKYLPDWIASFDTAAFLRRAGTLRRNIISQDCWKLSIPAILYVIQNNLQFVAASNLDVATFQVTYQMKILTTAAFSVLMLGKRLTAKKWLALFFLAVGVGIVQIQSGAPQHGPPPSQSPLGPIVVPAGSPLQDAERMAAVNNTVIDAAQQAYEGVSSAVSATQFTMNPFKGFMAVSAACVTSGLAGVYFEMVLKGSKADLWVRNVQLSLFSLLPAVTPILFNGNSSATGGGWFTFGFLHNFGLWAWATVLIQVLGGLVTAVVIKYSDNILKGFATSLSIVISFLASVVLFDFRLTSSFVLGATTVLGATATYNVSSDSKNEAKGSNGGVPGLSSGSGRGAMTRASPSAPILGHHMYKDKKRSSISSLKSFVGSLVPSSGKSSAIRAYDSSFAHVPSSSPAVTRTPLASPSFVGPGSLNGNGSSTDIPHLSPPAYQSGASRISSSDLISSPSSYQYIRHPVYQSVSGSTSPTTSYVTEGFTSQGASPYISKASSVIGDSSSPPSPAVSSPHVTGGQQEIEKGKKANEAGWRMG